MENNVLQRFAAKLNINNSKVLRKALEFLRLVEVKGSIKLNSAVLSVICLDLAASEYNISVDKALAIKLSGVTKKSYISNLNIIQQMLNLKTKVTYKYFCVQLNCEEVIPLVTNILARYDNLAKRQSSDQMIHMDVTTPAILGAAVHAACKVKNIKINQRKLYELCQTTKPIFIKLCSNMVKLAETLEVTEEQIQDEEYESLITTLKKQDDEYFDNNIKEKSTEEKTANYEEWKKKILESAKKAVNNGSDE